VLDSWIYPRTAVGLSAFRIAPQSVSGHAAHCCGLKHPAYLTKKSYRRVRLCTVFRLARNGQFTLLHAFQGGVEDGATPQPGLLLDRAGNLYGATAAGGDTENGIAFKISPDGTFNIVHRFAGNDGIIPNGGLVSDPAGNLFGTTQVGGFFGVGTELRVAPHV
jgi:uncharacterized repeat protein (TIGR03803 family)